MNKGSLYNSFRIAIERDSHAKVQMRKKVRGLRRIEKEVLASFRKSTT
jgi:hypothetical protein